MPRLRRRVVRQCVLLPPASVQHSKGTACLHPNMPVTFKSIFLCLISPSSPHTSVVSFFPRQLSFPLPVFLPSSCPNAFDRRSLFCLSQFRFTLALLDSPFLSNHLVFQPVFFFLPYFCPHHSSSI